MINITLTLTEEEAKDLLFKLSTELQDKEHEDKPPLPMSSPSDKDYSC